MTACQLQLRNLTLPALRPLVPLECVMVLADQHDYEIEAAVDCGALCPAWDIASLGAGSRELRIWNAGVDAYLQDRKLDERKFNLSLIFPHSRPHLWSTEIQRLFSCSASHVFNLIRDDLLEEVGTRAAVRARAKISRVSVEKFLKARIQGQLTTNKGTQK